MSSQVNTYGGESEEVVSSELDSGQFHIRTSLSHPGPARWSGEGEGEDYQINMWSGGHASRWSGEGINHQVARND